ncbi:hypothetical protein PMAYCL1PPCAC_20075, partial [Pristionchus mayeri]
GTIALGATVIAIIDIVLLARKVRALDRELAARPPPPAQSQQQHTTRVAPPPRPQKVRKPKREKQSKKPSEKKFTAADLDFVMRRLLIDRGAEKQDTKKGQSVGEVQSNWGPTVSQNHADEKEEEKDVAKIPEGTPKKEAEKKIPDVNDFPLIGKDSQPGEPYRIFGEEDFGDPVENVNTS